MAEPRYNLPREVGSIPYQGDKYHTDKARIAEELLQKSDRNCAVAVEKPPLLMSLRQQIDEVVGELVDANQRLSSLRHRVFGPLPENSHPEETEPSNPCEEAYLGMVLNTLRSVVIETRALAYDLSKIA